MAETSLALTVAPLVGLAFNVLCQIVSLRESRHGYLGYQLVYSIVQGIFSGLVLTVILTMQYGGDAAMFVVNILTYALLSFCYWAFINLNVTSLRIRLLRELLSGGLTRAQLSGIYNADEMLARRLKRLEAAGQIRHADGRYYLRGKKLLLLAGGVKLARRLILPALPKHRQ